MRKIQRNLRRVKKEKEDEIREEDLMKISMTIEEEG